MTLVKGSTHDRPVSPAGAVKAVLLLFYASVLHKKVPWGFISAQCFVFRILLIILAFRHGRFFFFFYFFLRLPGENSSLGKFEQFLVLVLCQLFENMCLGFVAAAVPKLTPNTCLASTAHSDL